MKQQFTTKDRELREKQREIDQLYGKLAAGCQLTEPEISQRPQEMLARGEMNVDARNRRMNVTRKDNGEPFHPQIDEEWFFWTREDGKQPTGASETFLSQLRSMSGIWQSLGVHAVDTNALCLPGQLIICMDIVDRAENVIIGTLRVDYLGASISAAWVSSSIAWEQTDIKQANPEDEVSFVVEPSGSVNGIDEAVAWLEAQLRRPVRLFRWTRGSNTIARLWMLADTGRELVASGFIRDTRTANAVNQIRP